MWIGGQVEEGQRRGSLPAQSSKPGEELARAKKDVGLDEWPPPQIAHWGKLRPMEGRPLAQSYIECSGRAGTGSVS